MLVGAAVVVVVCSIQVAAWLVCGIITGGGGGVTAVQVDTGMEGRGYTTHTGA